MSSAARFGGGGPGGLGGAHPEVARARGGCSMMEFAQEEYENRRLVGEERRDVTHC